jgi:uroporphyrinogen decarboxylase
MTEMTTRERMTCMFEHRTADRIPVTDQPWATTLARWEREGMPKNTDYVDYFGLEKFASVSGDNTPRCAPEVVEETDEWIIKVTPWGSHVKNFKTTTSTPEMVKPAMPDIREWPKMKARMTPDRDRVDWDAIKANYARWREGGYWIRGTLIFGFDITHARITGTENLLIAMMEYPEIVADMFNHQLNIKLALLDMIWDEGYTFDCAFWWDDMGYKFKQFFSLNTYREILKPVHKRAIDWAHAKGIFTELHSCGDINPIVPELIEIGLDGLNPLEVKAGMDPIHLKDTYGDDLVLHGGINALLWSEPEKFIAEMERVVPAMKENGGYIFSTDHSVPDVVSLEDFKRIIARAKELGAYT